MRIFVAGASGVIGMRLVPRLVAEGHVVAGMTRTASKATVLRECGAVPVVCDVFDLEALRNAVIEFAPDTVPRIHVDDAARRTAELLDSPTSIITIAEESS